MGEWPEDKPIIKTFITGKTLGENGNDLDRMFLISSAITKAFHGENATHSRYALVNGREDTGGSVLLSMQEQDVLVRALAEQRERQETAMSQTEQLLRRMTGSITVYMDMVGQQPLNMTDSDKAVLAIRDGNLKEFKELLPKITGKETLDMLFIEAAARPGGEGRKMTLLLLEDRVYSESVYKQACEKAVEIVDTEKTAFLQEQAKEHTDKLSPGFFSELARYAFSWPGVWFMAKQIIGRCSREEVLAAPKSLMEISAVCGQMGVPEIMAEKGVNGDHIGPVGLVLCEGWHKGSSFLSVKNIFGQKKRARNFFLARSNFSIHFFICSALFLNHAGSNLASRGGGIPKNTGFFTAFFWPH